jgi:hypothetical protein
VSEAAFDPQAASLIMNAGNRLMLADPLELFTPMSDEQERVLHEIGRGEILVGSGNQAGKTTLGKMFVAMAQGREFLGGIRLPRIPTPNVFVVASLDFEQQRLSVQPKYLEAIGTWPHKPEWDRETLKSLRIRPIGHRDDDPKTWSLISFISAKNLSAGTGFRGNGYHCDEPPPMWLLRELRKMAQPGEICVGIITATMVKRSQWYPMRLDYPDPTQNTGKWLNGFLRLRAPAFNPDDLDDISVGNRALTRSDKQRLMDLYANDPDRDARILGLEIDTANTSPFRHVMDELQRQFERARPGVKELIEVTREVPTTDGKVAVTELVDLEVWEKAKPNCIYKLILDTSMGIDDGRHDPANLNIVNMTEGRQAARYSGFVGELGSGVLAGLLSRRYNDGFVRVGTTGGYGDTCLTGLRLVGCRNIDTRDIVGKDGKLQRTMIGYKEDAGTRTAHATALIDVFKSARMGAPYYQIQSPDDLAELIDLTFNSKDRVAPQSGLHDEALAVHGEAAMLLAPDRKRRAIADSKQRSPMGPIEMMRRAMGLPRRPDDASPGSARPRFSMPKQRARYR